MTNPAEFAVSVLGKTPYEWQAESLTAVWMQDRTGLPVSLVAANGSGKTSDVIAVLILWFLSEFPRGQVVVTSGSFRQIEKQLWPALRVYSNRFPKWTFLQTEIKTPEGGFAIGFSTDDPGRAEGFHPRTSSAVDPVMIICDEAKTVPDAVFQAFDRCTRRFQLWASSPGAPMGQFYESHHARADEFYAIKVTSEMCPHIPAEKRERDARTYGEDHPVYRSMHLAEFTEDTDRLVIDAPRLRAALDGQPSANHNGEAVAFCDFAAGGDENVLAVRRGNHASIIKSWRDKDTMQAVREFSSLFHAQRLTASQIWGDADGLGTVMIDALAEAGWRINRFHGGQTAEDADSYANRIGECWHVGAREIERGRIHLGQLSAEAFKQITTRKSEWSSNGKLRVQDKETMRKNGIHSPDLADALLGCIYCGSRLRGTLGESSIIESHHKPLMGSGIITDF